MSSSAPVLYLVSPAPAVLPAQGTLDLFTSYGIDFTSAAQVAPTVSLTSLTNLTSLSLSAEIASFFTDSFPQLRPNTYSPTALHYVTFTTGTAVGSAIYNFKTVSNNACSDSVPPEQAKVMHAAIGNLEGIYNNPALQYLLGLFSTHTADTTDNPHQDTSFFNLWNDFFGILYDAYVAAACPQVTPASAITEYLSALYPADPKGFDLQIGSYINVAGATVINTQTFIADKTVPFLLAQPTDFLAAAGVADPAAAIADYFSQTYVAELNSLGGSNVALLDYTWAPTTPVAPLTTVVSVEVFTGVLAWHEDGVDSTIHPTLQESLAPDITIPFASYALDQVFQADLVVANSSVVITGALSHRQGALLVSATLGTTASQTTVLTLTNTATADSLTIFQPTTTTNVYTVSLVIAGTTYTHVLNNVSNPLGLIVSYSGSTVDLYYLDGTGTVQTVAFTVTPLYLDVNRLTLGYGMGLGAGTIQAVITYPTALSTAQASLFLTALPT